MLPAEDARLVQIADAALADATLRGGNWLACKPGCFQCCIGVFPISPLDAERLRTGLLELSTQDPFRASHLRDRVRASLLALQDGFPGNFATGAVNVDDAAFDEFANDAICPVLDPATGTCDLYASRPMTCRTFGPPVRNEGGLGICELCFTEATVEEIAASEMQVDFLEDEARLSDTLGTEPTFIALALRGI